MDEQQPPTQDTAERDAKLLRLLAEWWEPPAELIATLPKGGVHLKYLGHSDTSRALTECDPGWEWEPMAYGPDGLPAFDVNDKGQPIGLWAWLTVCGVRRPCYGSVMPGKSDAVKELIGDVLRNGALRFGVAGSLWSKADRSSDDKPKPKAAAVSHVSTALEQQLPAEKAPAKSDPDNPAHLQGKAAYDAMVEDHGEEIVNGALATFNVAKFSELTPAKVKVIHASLVARARLVREETERAQQLAREQVEAKGKANE